MATAKSRRLSKILHVQASDEMNQLEKLGPDELLSVEDQVRIMEKRKHVPGGREDKRFPDVWIKGDGTVVAVRDMSRDHMCMTVGLWLRKEFEAKEAEQLGFFAPPPVTATSVAKVSAYDSPEVWLTASESVLTTPALKTMLARLEGMEGGMEHLQSLLQQRVVESLESAHQVPDHHLFIRPAFF